MGMSAITKKQSNVALARDTKKQSNVELARDHIQYDPWIGSLDISRYGIVLNVEKEGVQWFKDANEFPYLKDSYEFPYPGISCLRVKLKPPTKFFRYNDALRSNLVSVFSKKDIPTSLALITLEFLNWYGTKITLRHHANNLNDSSRCFVDIRLENATRQEKPSLVLARKFPIKNNWHVYVHEIFVPKEELRRFSNPSIIIRYHRESNSYYWLCGLELSLSSEEEALELPRNFNAIRNNKKRPWMTIF